MIPQFMPVIGRDFTDIANQQAQWQGFNRGVEENNLARADRAQEVQNNWLAQVAQMRDAAQQRDLNLQLSADAEARHAAETAINRSIQGSQFEKSLAQQAAAAKDRITAEENRTVAMTAQDKAKLEAQLQRKQDEISNSATDFAANYGLLDSEVNDANKEFALATQELTAAQAKKAIDPTKVTAADIKNLETQQRVSERALKSASDKRFYERKRIEGKGFQVNDAQGHIFHPELNKKWNFRDAVEAATEAQSPPESSLLSALRPPVMDVSAPTLPVTGSTGWAGFNPNSTGTTPPPVAAPTARPSGRYKDASGKTWVYVGTASVPLSDTNPANWKEE